MEFTALQIAQYLGGDVVGNGDVKVSDVSRIEEGRPGTLSFLANPKYADYIYSTGASVVLVNRDFEPQRPVEATLIRVDNAYECLARLLQLVESAKPRKEGISSLAFVSDSAKIGERVYIGPFAYVGENVEVGDGTQIYPHVFVDDDCVLGQDCIIKAGCKIGNHTMMGSRVVMQAGVACGFDGFGFARQADGRYEKLPQVGNVIIEDDVEIQSNSCIDRATMGSTIVHRGVKIDNLVQVAHNCEVGEDTVLCGQVGMAGSTKLGRGVTATGQVGFAGHMSIADGSVFAAKTGIMSSVKKTGIYMGYPAMDAAQFKKSAVLFRHLDEMNRTIENLKKKINELEEKTKQS